MRKFKVLSAFLLAGFLFAACGRDSNIFKFAHKPGSSSDTTSLLNDAQVALVNKNYSDAMNYYSQVLAKSPNNSEALYGYSAARLNSVLPIGDILASAIKNNSSAPRPVLSGAIKLAVGASESDLSFLPKNLNYINVKSAAEAAVANLRRIASGLADGVIPPDDVDVLVNLIVCLVIYEAINVVDFDGDGSIEDDPDDIVTVTQNYEIRVNPRTPNQEEKDDIKNRLDNLYNTVSNEVLGYLNTIILKIGAQSGSTLDNLRQDITDLKNAVDEAKAEVQAL